MINRDQHPEIHEFFPNRPPTSLKFCMLRAFIMVNNEPHYISAEIEDYFASGKNYEHSDGSVHQTKLEALFKVYKWWNEITTAAKVARYTVSKILTFLFFLC